MRPRPPVPMPTSTRPPVSWSSVLRLLARWTGLCSGVTNTAQPSRSHVHFWDGSPANQKNRYAEGWVECFYNYHKNLSPPDYVWPLEQYQRYSEQQMMKDLFEEGYVDVAIFQPTYLKDFFTNGWNTTEQDAALKEKHPDKFILNSAFDPRDGAE